MMFSHDGESITNPPGFLQKAQGAPVPSAAWRYDSVWHQVKLRVCLEVSAANRDFRKKELTKIKQEKRSAKAFWKKKKKKNGTFSKASLESFVLKSCCKLRKSSEQEERCLSGSLPTYIFLPGFNKWSSRVQYWVLQYTLYSFEV